MSAGRLLDEGRWWLLLAFLLVTPCVLGTAGGIAAVAAAMLFVPALLAPGAAALAFRQPAVVIFAGAFAVLLAVFAINARAPGDLIYIFNFLSLPMAAGVYVVARRRAGEDAALAIAFGCLLGAAAAAAVAVHEVYVVGWSRAQGGFYSNPNPFARIALLLGFFSLVGLLASSRRVRFVLVLGPAFGIAATIMAGSRGTMVALPVFLVVCLTVFLALLVTASRRRRAVIAALAVLAGGAAAIGIAAAIDLDALVRLTGLREAVGEVLATGTSGEGAIQRRLDLYGAGLAAFAEAPLLGHGWAAVIDVVIALSGNEQLGSHRSLHNDFLDFAVAGGAVGIAVLTAVLAAPLAGALAGPREGRTWPARLYGGLLLSLGYLAYGLTDSVIGNDLPTNVYPLLTALLLGAVRED